MNCTKTFFWLVVCCFLLPALARGADNVLITEFMAANDGLIVDEDGDPEDWIEIHNAGTNVVNLDGWFLTDRSSQLTQWSFPPTNLAPNAYMIVFASAKNRRTPGAPLHTNFRLNNNGEFLALVRPDGVMIASQYSPAYPPQVPNASYGLPVVPMFTTLLPTGALARVRVPADGSQDPAWIAPAFDDSSWSSLPTGVGFDRDGVTPFVPVTVANSVSEFSGTQGQNNWHYGYWNQKSDIDGTYSDADFVAFPNSGGGWSANNFWTGSLWDWFNGDPPYTQLNSQGGRPSGDDGNAGLPNHWVIRRYLSESNGPLAITGRITHTSDWVYVTQTGVAGAGAIYLYLQGAGEAYIDDIKLVAGTTPEAGASLINNGDFEQPNLTPSWSVSFNMGASSLSTSIKHGGNRSLRMIASAAGSTSSDSIYQSFSVTAGNVYTLSYWYLAVTNNPPGVVRMSGRWIDTEPHGAGDGVIARILVDGAEMFRQPAYVFSGDYSVVVPAQAGSRVDFTLDSGANNDSAADLATFTATVSTADPNLMTVADTETDWSLSGTQGENNWFYGYYNKTADPDATYQAANFIPFPRALGPQGSNNFWDEFEWDWPSGDPPFDKIGRYWMTPNGTNSGAQHWVIKRWVSEVAGTITIDWSALKEFPDQYNLGGGGVIVRLFHNGVQRDSANVRGADTIGVRRTVTISSVQVGDTIDIAIDPTNVGNVDGTVTTPAGPHDDTDKTFVTASIRGAPTLNNLVRSDITAQMHGVNASAYLRLPFTVADPSVFNVLTLRAKYDDGLIAYLNGVEVARVNAPMSAAWDSAATTSRPDADNNQWQEWNLTTWLGLLRTGTNVLAIHGLNVNASDNDFLILPELVAGTVTNDVTSPRYFSAPTPGAANGVGSSTLGPLVVEASHTPDIPLDNEPITVTASLTPTFYPLDSVRLIYRVMFSNEVNVPMFDDGAHGDGAAGDGLWGATIPTNASNPGQMVRYYIYATDTQGGATRFPSFLEPKNSPQYFGTVVVDPALTNQLPVLQFFTADPVAATNFAGTRGSIFWDGEFFDNIGVNAHGQTTWYVFAKKSMNFNLNSGYQVRPRPGAKRVKAFDLLTTAADKAYLRMALGFETFAEAGVPTHDAFLVRLQKNGQFEAVMTWVEQADDDFLERNGLSSTGAFYKVYLNLTDAYTGVKKITRTDESNEDLQSMLDGLDLNQPLSEVRKYLFDHVDIPEVVNFLATIQLVQNEDCCSKNYFLYRDTPGTGEWQMFPWDLDLTFGRTFTAWCGDGNCSGEPFVWGGYYDTNTYYTNRWYWQGRNAFDYIGVGTHMPNAIFSFPDTYAMFFRRWTTIQEEFLQKIGTHPLALRMEKRVDEMGAQAAADAALDFTKWLPHQPRGFLTNMTLPMAVTLMKTGYFAPRRPWIFNTLAFANGGPNVGTQPSNAVIRIGALEINPSSGNQDQEYIQLLNTNNYSVDVSGWKLSGGIEFTFKPGTVIASNGVLYVSPNVNAFRARTAGPRGGQGLFVQGNYSGRLTARGESLQLADQNGRVVAATNYPAMPSLAQQYLRITEIMYSPAPPPPGMSADADEFEFIELKNIGPSALSLLGVKFTDGILFNFTGSAVTNLAAGASVVVVRNAAAFVSRYGGAVPVAGQYTGLLENAGENIRLEDATGEKILEFAYDNDWYPITDGLGFSLVIVNEAAPWDTWGWKSSWRPSSREGGSPGEMNPAADVIPAVVINEVNSHTVPPAIDAVELHNPTGDDADVSGWFLTDDFRTPRKYRIADLTFLASGDYTMFTEAQFNPTNPPSPAGFAFASDGDEVFLFSATAAGELTGYYHGFRFGAAAAGVSFGRYVTSVGEEHFVAQTANTLPGENAGPKVGPVVISEIHYRPPDYDGGVDNSDDEFVELHNISGAPATLFAGTNAWQVRGGVDFDFPSSATLGSNGFALLVNFDPADTNRATAFRAQFNVPASVPLFGPYAGELDNSSAAVRLSRPDVPPGAGLRYVLVDAVDYRDRAPWPAAADGQGPSLQRLAANEYGNDPINWIAAAPSAGRATGAGTPPAITTQPTNVVAIATSPVTFAVEATGTAPLSYQWSFNGNTIAGATGATLTIASAFPADSGLYSVNVFNGAGSVRSSNALLSVGYGPFFTQHPASTNIRAGLTVTNRAAAFGNPPVTYEWRLNGTNAPGTVSSTSSNSTLVITNIQAWHAGTLICYATDSAGTVPSAPATVNVTFTPLIVQQPVSQSAVTGATVTFSVAVTNNATLPILYRWRTNSTIMPGAGYLLNERMSFFTFTNVRAPFTSFSVSISNVAASSVLSATATVSLQADSDGDGIPDAWESQYGLLPGDGTDGALDADGDGMTNREEYIAGTDPTDEFSYLKVELAGVGSGADISFGAVSNRTYSVLYADAVEGPWRKLGDFPARATSRVESIRDPNYTTNRFYQVVIPRQP